jgi:hypothetical protein
MLHNVGSSQPSIRLESASEAGQVQSDTRMGMDPVGQVQKRIPHEFIPSRIGYLMNGVITRNPGTARLGHKASHSGGPTRGARVPSPATRGQLPSSAGLHCAVFNPLVSRQAVARALRPRQLAITKNGPFPAGIHMATCLLLASSPIPYHRLATPLRRLHDRDSSLGLQ